MRTTLVSPAGLLLAAIAATACAHPASPPTTFEPLSSGARPWTSDRVDQSAGKFTFAIFSDLYDGDRPGVFEVATAQLALLHPTFIMSVGDLISGGTEDRELLTREWDRFDTRARKAGPPVLHVGGNHDLTNQVQKDVFAARYGRTYYSFLYDNVLFLVLDSEDYPPERMRQIYLARDSALKVLDGPHPEQAGSMTYFKMPERMTGEIGPEQSAYLRRVIAEHPGVRWTFLFMHKPVWQREGETGFAAIESALAGRPYTVFNGHLHRYAATVRNGHDYITLGTTSGSQDPKDSMAFDHVTWVTMTDQGPAITNLRLEGILDRTGHVPAGGDTLCFQASRCGRPPR